MLVCPPWILVLVRLLLCLGIVLWAAPSAQAQGEAWNVLKSAGHAIFMRHSDAPGGVGDPPGFSADDCATQRNLSEAGRAQARRTREALSRNGVVFDEVLTSPWCRCRETALLVTGQKGEDLDALSNLVGRQENRERQVSALKAYLAKLEPSRRALFVTHGVVISALLGITPAQGEMIVVPIGTNSGPTVAARLLVD